MVAVELLQHRHQSIMTMISYGFGFFIDKFIRMVTHEREEGVYMGIRLFFGRLVLVTQIIIFAVVHELTGFIEGGNPMDQPTSAIFGIHLNSSLIPALVVAIATLIFWCLYDLKPTKVAEIQQKLKAMNL